MHLEPQSIRFRKGAFRAVTDPAQPHTIDLNRIERAVREILLALGEDPERDGLQETPNRVARAYGEMLAGTHEDAADHLSRRFRHAGDANDVVILRNIRFSSVCEHHLLPFTGQAHVAYLPGAGTVAGLSKLARTVDVFARRLQLQERLTCQIADSLIEHLAPRGVAVVLEAEHSCLKVRGAAKHEAEMVTTAFRGIFLEDRAFRGEILSLLRGDQSRP